LIPRGVEVAQSHLEIERSRPNRADSHTCFRPKKGLPSGNTGLRRRPSTGRLTIAPEFEHWHSNCDAVRPIGSFLLAELAVEE
jgi:hypothetical protein